MNKKIFILFFVCLALIIGCGKDNPVSEAQSKQGTVTGNQGSVSKKAGSIQISGLGVFDAPDACDAQSQGAAYSLTMSGDLEGFLYTYVDEFECSPSGTYREVGREYFVGTYNGQQGTFRTNYKFEAKYEGCAANGSFVGAEIKGRCQHPIEVGSGTGVFEGVTGRLDMKDDIAAGNYPFTGHLQF
jgi:hypothetical protein